MYSGQLCISSTVLVCGKIQVKYLKERDFQTSLQKNPDCGDVWKWEQIVLSLFTHSLCDMLTQWLSDSVNQWLSESEVMRLLHAIFSAAAQQTWWIILQNITFDSFFYNVFFFSSPFDDLKARDCHTALSLILQIQTCIFFFFCFIYIFFTLLTLL